MRRDGRDGGRPALFCADEYPLTSGCGRDEFSSRKREIARSSEIRLANKS